MNLCLIHLMSKNKAQIHFYLNKNEIEKMSTSKNVMRINFEDLIYKYDETKKKIEKFLGFENRKQLNPKKYFNPDVSIKNTKLYTNKEYASEVAYIEKNLKEYLYEIPKNR